jgi:hypothetical protein
VVGQLRVCEQNAASDIFSSQSTQEGSSMQHVVRCLVVLIIVALAAPPAWAAELRVTGFFDNVFPRWDSNNSNADLDPTRNHDQIFAGRTRMRNFFNCPSATAGGSAACPSTSPRCVPSTSTIWTRVEEI